MKTNSTTWTSFLVLAGAALAVQAAPVLGQPVDEAVEEVVVTAPVERHFEGRSLTGAPIEVIELTRRIRITDLDLGNPDDLLELDRRIETVAREACETLNRMYPFDSTGRSEIVRCTRRAIAGTEDQKRSAIAHAG